MVNSEHANSQDLKSSGNSDFFTLPVLALVNSHIETNTGCMLHPFCWHLTGDIDEKIAPVHRTDIKKAGLPPERNLYLLVS